MKNLFCALFLLVTLNLQAAGVGTYVWPGGPDVAVSAITTLSTSAYRRWHACTGTSYTITLPAGQAAGSIGFRVSASGTVTLSPASGTIDGAATKLLVANETAVILSDGTNWQTIAFYGSSSTTAAVTVGSAKILDSGGDHTITIDTASNEAANRTLTIPALGGNKTLALVDVAQTFSAAQAITGASNAFKVGTPTTADALADTLLTPSATTQKAIVLQALAGQTAPLLEVHSSAGAGTVLAQITAAGNFVSSGQYGTSGWNVFQGGGASGGLGLGSGHLITWNSASASTGTVSGDTGLACSAAGVIKATDASTGIRGFLGGGTAVASAAAMPVPTGRVFHVTGTDNITSITSTNFQAGAVITLIFDGVLTFTDGNNLKLAGNFTTSADDTITLVYDGTNWHECSRSAN